MKCVFFTLALLGVVGSGAHPTKEVAVFWKPKPDTYLSDLQNISGVPLHATRVSVYCGFGTHDNGTFGVPAHTNGYQWGSPETCVDAIPAALSLGLQVDVMVEGRTPAMTHAINGGGHSFGAAAVQMINSYFPNNASSLGLNFDFERGHDKSAPMPTQEEFSGFIRQVGHYANVSLCVASWSRWTANYTSLIEDSGATRVWDMSTYHATSATEWKEKLRSEVDNARYVVDKYSVGFELSPKYQYEKEASSVGQRLRILERNHKSVHSVCIFAWPTRYSALLSEWSHALRHFRDSNE